MLCENTKKPATSDSSLDPKIKKWGGGSTVDKTVVLLRSRIHINGAKILTDKTLDVELKPGDKVKHFWQNGGIFTATAFR